MTVGIARAEKVSIRVCLEVIDTCWVVVVERLCNLTVSEFLKVSNCDLFNIVACLLLWQFFLAGKSVVVDHLLLLIGFVVFDGQLG